MKPSLIRPFAIVLLTMFDMAFVPPAQAADDNILDPEEWPHVYEVGGAEVAIYMPQILEWDEFRHLKGTSAIGVKLAGAKEASFGAVAIDADTVADMAHGTVQIGKREFSGFRFPELSAEDETKAEQLVRSVLTPDSPMELPVSAVTSALSRDEASLQETAVSFEPPPIFYSSSPAVLVTFIGQPSFEAAGDDPSLMFATNTNWDVLFDGTDYYLFAENQWLTSKDALKGPWVRAKALPASFGKLPDDANWADVKASLEHPASPDAAPVVFASDRPAEIILTKGKPQLVPVSGTKLMYVINTESDLFLHPSQKTYYLLTAGRWFSAPSLEGPWNSAVDSLPADFSHIPATHPKAHVLASVKGTPEADEAVILASIPETASVDRSTTVKVVYEGAPQFKPVPGTSDVQFAVNTSYDVLLVSGRYYCCHQGVWFQASQATGAWVVCDQVPPAIYTIPATSPKHHVTYVYVYDSTPTTVHVGVTSGYSGCYIARGLVVFGLGMWLGHELADDHWHHHYYPRPCWYGYGCGAVYYHGHGFCGHGGRYYGPYGGVGYSAVYHPGTGVYTRSAYAYGPRGAVVARSAYNPWTDTAAGRVTVKTPYGSWGRSAVVRDDEWIRAGHHSNINGTVAGVQTSRGGSAVAVNRRFGSDAFITKTAGGDVYVGKDGNIYKKDADDGWQKRDSGGWVRDPSVPAEPVRPSRPDVDDRPGSPSRPSTLPVNSPTRPLEKPEAPVTRPVTPARKPEAPVTRPATPARKPEAPASRPATTPVKKPGTPAAKPSTRPASHTGYKSTQSTASKLNRDSYSRSRSTRSSPSRSTSSSSSSASSKSGRSRR